MKPYIKETYRVARTGLFTLTALITVIGFASMLHSETMIYNGLRFRDRMTEFSIINLSVAGIILIFVSYIQEDFKRAEHQAQLIVLGYNPTQTQQIFEHVMMRDVDTVIFIMTCVGIVVLKPMLGSLTPTQWLILLQIPVSFVCLANLLLITFQGMKVTIVGFVLILASPLMMEQSLVFAIIRLVLLLIIIGIAHVYRKRPLTRTSLDL